MHPNDQQFDQLFRDRLRDHASPVRADLWRRIQNGIGRRGLYVPYWPLLAAIPVACLIIFIVNPHILHNSSIPTHPPLTTHPPVSTLPSVATLPSVSTRPRITTRPSIPTPQSTAGHVNHYSIISTPEKGSSTKPKTSHADHSTSTDRTISASTPANHTTPAPAPLATSTRVRPNLTLPSLAHFSARGTIPDCPLTPRSKFKPTLDAGTGPDFYLSAIGGVNYPVIAYHNAYTTGIRLTVQITPHWSATTGLQYSWANFPKGQDTLANLFPKTFRNLAIPILIGYTFPGDHHSFAVNAGVVLNLYSSATFNYDVYDFPGQTGPSTYLDFIYTRNINDRWSLFAEPYSTYFFNEKNTDPLYHRWAIDCHLGIRYHL
jgi:hypothetical protein